MIGWLLFQFHINIDAEVVLGNPWGTVATVSYKLGKNAIIGYRYEEWSSSGF